MRLLALFLVLGGVASYAQTTESIPFRAELSPLNEIPIIEGLAASGKATVWLHVVRNAQGDITRAAVDFGVRYNFPGAVTVTGLHIHRGTAAVNGPVVIDSGIRGATATEDATGRAGAVRQAAVTSADGLAVVRDLLASPEAFYVNLHTTVNPGGAIRGQVVRATMSVTMGQMSAAKEVPAIADLTATGAATIISLAARNAQGRLVSGEVTFDVQYTGFAAGTRFTGLHIHSGAAGTNGPVVVNTGLTTAEAPASGTGSFRYTVDVDANNTNAAAALTALAANPASHYVNLHTAVNPGGAIRTNLQAADTAVISLNATPGQEVPPIEGLNASAASRNTIHSVRDAAGRVVASTVIFNVSHAFPADTTFTGLHFHEGVAGQNGPVRINSALRSSASPGGVGNLYFIAPVTSADGLNAVNGLLTNPANYYFNLHTMVNPGGAVRAQVAAASIDLPVITNAFGVVGGADASLAGLRSRFRIAGTNLAFGTAAASDGTQPDALSGTTVTVDGFTAPLISVSPTSIVALLPDAVALGPVPVRTLPVYVTNRNGRSNVGNITVSVNPGDGR